MESGYPLQMDVAFSIIIPAYNESARLPPFLTTVREYLDGRHPDAYEVIVVDDGSEKPLADELHADPAWRDWPQLAVMRHEVNRGKGAAVRAGMLEAAGELLLFADADGATPIDQASPLAEAIGGGADVAVGSRLIAEAQVARQRTLLRWLVGRLFAGFARWWLGIRIRDTQCGFKMFRRDAARKLFLAGRESRYLFDLELLVLADRFDYRVVEVPVNWNEIPGGHLSMTRELFRVFGGLWRLRRRLFAKP